MPKARPGVLVSLAVSMLLVVTFACTRYTPAPADMPGMQRYAEDPKMRELLADPFPGMNGIPAGQLTADEIRGRVVWNLWTGDSWKMWDYLAKHGFGTSDLLKVLDSRSRTGRFKKFGTINQPGYMTATTPDQWGLMLDVPRPGDPEGDIDSRLNIDPYTYGRSSGVMGLRIFDNPEFVKSQKAQDDWKKHIAADGINHDYYESPQYYNNPALVRPYVVGMACSFCHVSFDPVRPPDDVDEPKYSNLNDYVGAQYLKVYEVFGHYMTDESFVKQLLRTNAPGALDTSFIATDYLNNPGTMNGVFSLPQRVSRGAPASLVAQAGHEYLAGGSLDLLNLRNMIEKGGYPIPRVLKQGDDSVGFEGALSRVYLNIGEAWPEWSRHFKPLVGGRHPRQSPVPVKTLQERSTNWNWTENRSPALATYLINRARPLLLKDAPGGMSYITKDKAVLDRGKLVFAQNCARCHSSKQPEESVDPASAAGTAWFVARVQSDPEFFTDNFLADERRHPVTEIGTNATRAAATNAMRGRIWDNFSSETYKTLPAVPALQLPRNPLETNPHTTDTFAFQLPAGGPGYYRPASLISLWSSAPYLHNNTVGPREPADPSVAGRMAAFNEGIERMLLIQPRENIVWKTDRTSYITIPASYAPKILQAIFKHRDLKDAEGNLRIGPIPKGTPVNLLSNVNLEADRRKLARLGLSLTGALLDIRVKHLDEQQATERMREVIPHLMAVNHCPDFIEDKGHMFGTTLPLADKRALIELLKTF
jgi:hypothetical protein